MKKYILAIDQGTTGSTAIICDESFNIVSKENIEFNQHFPKPGLVEHDLDEIFDSVKKSILAAIKSAKIDANEIKSIGITNQRETTCAYNKKGEPLSKAIVWQDRRTSDFCSKNKSKYEFLKEVTGLPLDPYFSATKMRWLLKNNKNVKKAQSENDLYLSTIDTFLLYRLTNCKSFMTEASNASRTLLMNLKTCEWDNKLLKFFSVSKKCLPDIRDSFYEFGKTENLDFLPDGISINCILGDQQAALFGQSGINKGDIKCTYGTGAFILANTGKDIVHSKNGLLTTVAFKHEGLTKYAIEGSTYIAGAAVQWLRDNLKIIKNSSEVEELALNSKEENTEDLFFFPFFTGVGAPYWNSEVKGSITGLTRGTDRSDLAKVCLEGIAQSVCDSISAIEKDLNKKLDDIRVDGGASLNNFLMQIQSNFSQSKIVRPKVVETTAFGVILGSALASGDLSLKEISKEVEIDCAFEAEKQNYYKNKRNKWKSFLKTQTS